ncbi:MAG TPA: site-2 protease family protein [Candidatus Omnitrophota bacterium]|nr:site-2 protease family protein [Candidatus Omnitrophota bacterium]HPD83899.1 site-2 protease family protein [Candidatus Omnitrophota bacterium]HRZ02756.1 site-2 protease family protein [Candidatus Omnitrophota bacterium]
MSMSIIGFAAIILVFFYSVILHEIAHGFVAYRLGDPTAKLAGRLTLNPLKHVDPLGTIILPAVLLFINSSIIFGWAKPVPINFMNLRHPKRDIMWVGISGPLTNILLAVLFSQFLRLDLALPYIQIIKLAVTINLILAIFNLIPIPPLDGSRLVFSLLPSKYAYLYGRMENYGILIVLALLYLGLLDRVVWPLVNIAGYYLGLGT